MINTQTLARPYAKAAFEFASSVDQTQAWSKMLNLAAVAVEVPEVDALLNDPRLTSDSKVEALVRVLGNDADEAFRNFVRTWARTIAWPFCRPCGSCTRTSRRKPRKRSRQKLKPPSSSATRNSKLWLPPCRSG